ncbi:hypothetical protein [Blastococcus sp. CT_GayMR16]|uniref:hypothetical protein n=1 Tax=Blastococcus sp. CT_GayMR16 TaxID=2559607 RepID=UPI001074689E|nr:hypothetical protein [Blastococcus sp. CT_GayMR16]TFV90416.1 hypothetical protein E4P38_02965 [Blastococcus sp. CT_GayMR16]
MADPRTYIRVHDGMDEHPKIEPLSDAAFRLLHKCWAYCSRQKTDGRLTDAAWQNRGTAKARQELVDAGLVHLPGFECPHPAEDCPPAPGGHVQMHDYLDWQRSAAEIEELSRKRSEAGRRGGRARAGSRASAKQVPEPVAGNVEADTETDTETSLRSVSDAPRRGGRGSRIPDDFAVDDELRGFGRGLGFTDERVDAITATFIDYWRGRSGAGGVKLDWPATWRNWIRKEAERSPRPVGATAASGRPSWEL